MMIDDKIVRCRNWMRKIIDAPNVDGWQKFIDSPDADFTDPDFANDVDISDADFTDPDFANDVDISDDEIKRKDFVDNRYPEYVKKVMLTEEKYQGKEISDVEYEEYEERMSKKKEKEHEDKTLKEKETEDNKILKEKESYEEKQERYYKSFEAMQKKYPYLTDIEISEKLKVEKDKESYKDNNDDDLLDEAKKEYERMHGNNSFYMQIKRVYKLMTEKGINFDTAFKSCKLPDRYKKHIMKALQKLKEKE